MFFGFDIVNISYSFEDWNARLIVTVQTDFVWILHFTK